MIETIFSGAPHELRNFVHKRLFRGVKSFVTSGFSPTAAAAGFLSSGDPVQRVSLPVRRPPPRTTTARPSRVSAEEKEEGRQLKFPPGEPIFRAFQPRRQIQAIVAPPSQRGRCPGAFSVRGPDGTCIDLTALPPGGRPAITRQGPPGDAVMGRFGAALEPGSRIIDRAVCLPGMVVAKDGLCYNKRSLRNSDRMWPRGRRPLLTGGDMRAISIAARAANRLTRTAVRLHEIGLIKKPIARKPRKKSAH